MSAHEPIVSAEMEPHPSKAIKAALALQGAGFTVLHIGTTISVQAPRGVWEATFGTPDRSTKARAPGRAGSEGREVRIPEALTDLIANIAIAEPPEFFR
jgi:hypothetical protein